MRSSYVHLRNGVRASRAQVIEIRVSLGDLTVWCLIIGAACVRTIGGLPTTSIGDDDVALRVGHAANGHLIHATRRNCVRGPPNGLGERPHPKGERGKRDSQDTPTPLPDRSAPAYLGADAPLCPCPARRAPRRLCRKCGARPGSRTGSV